MGKIILSGGKGNRKNELNKGRGDEGTDRGQGRDDWSPRCDFW